MIGQQNNLFGKPQQGIGMLSTGQNNPNPFQSNPNQGFYQQQPFIQQQQPIQQPLFQQQIQFQQPMQQSAGFPNQYQQPITQPQMNDFQQLQQNVVTYQPTSFYQRAISNQFNEGQIMEIKQQVKSEAFKQGFQNALTSATTKEVQQTFESVRNLKFPELLVSKFDFHFEQQSQNEDELIRRQMELLNQAKDFTRGLAVIDKGATDFYLALDDISKETRQCSDDVNQINQYLQRDKQIGAHQVVEFPHSAHLQCLNNQRNQLNKIADNLDAQIKIFYVALRPHTQGTIRYSQFEQLHNYFDLLKIRIKNIDDRGISIYKSQQINQKERNWHLERLTKIQVLHILRQCRW
ncbi:hypothetical protein pb186bvf_009487 [Paramecium bursaria]